MWGSFFVREMGDFGVKVNLKHWDFKKNEPKPNCPNRNHLLKIIQNKKAEYQTQVLNAKSDYNHCNRFPRF